jgi:hypothetical protein
MKCLAPNCRWPIPGNHFACAEHWHLLSRNSQSRIFQAYRAWRRGSISDLAWENLRAEISQELVQADDLRTPSAPSGAAA